MVRNVGSGAASKIWMFLPGLTIERLPGPIAASDKFPRKLKLSDREAFVNPIPIYARVVVEFEDHAGNLYRQYGTPNQKILLRNRYEYDIEELDRPFLVPQRIIPQDDGSGFILKG